MNIAISKIDLFSKTKLLPNTHKKIYKKPPTPGADPEGGGTKGPWPPPKPLDYYVI